MQELLQKFFGETKIMPDGNLASLMWSVIEKKMKRLIYMRLTFYSLILFLTVVSFYNLMPNIYADFSSSWVGNLFSIVFSEGLGTLSVIWKDLAYGIVESFPVVSLIIISSLLFILILSINKIVVYKRKLFNH